MKKMIALLIFILFLSVNNVFAHPYYRNDYHYGYHNHGYHNYYAYSSCSTCAYIIKSEAFQEEQKIANCDKHTILVDTIINFYSNGTRRIYNSYSILNNDKTVLISNCSDIKHISYNKKHYFLIKKDRYYKIIDENGIDCTKRNYTFMDEIAPNRILVYLNKKFGVIDIKENVIVPFKYSDFKQINNNLFMTKLNGYYGLIDSSNNILLKNEYDNIKILYDTLKTKKEGKFGLVSINGEIILDANNDKIKKLGEYILVKKDGRYGIYSSTGEKISDIKYKKIKLERNQLMVKENKIWENL